MTHLSSCAVHNMPAYPNKPCDCGEWAREIVENLRGDDDELLPFVTLRVVENALIAAEKRGRETGIKQGMAWSWDQLVAGKHNAAAEYLTDCIERLADELEKANG